MSGWPKGWGIWCAGLILSHYPLVYLYWLFMADIFYDCLGVHFDWLMGLGPSWALQIFGIIPVICDVMKMYSWVPLILSEWTQGDHTHQVWRRCLHFSTRLHRTICFIDVHKNKGFQHFEIYLLGTWRIYQIAVQIRLFTYFETWAHHYFHCTPHQT